MKARCSIALIYPGSSPALSGKLGPNVFSRNSGGQYVRARVHPVNPGSAPQLGVRAIFGTLSTFWTTMSQPDRDGWAAWGSATPHQNRIGASIKLSGNAAFIAANSVRLNAGLDIVEAPPAINALATLTPPVPGAAPTAGDTEQAFTLTAGDDWNVTGGALTFYFSRPQNPSVNFFKGPYGLASPIALGGTVALSGVTLTLPFGSEGVAGGKLFYRCIGTAPDGRPTQEFAGVIVIA